MLYTLAAFSTAGGELNARTLMNGRANRCYRNWHKPRSTEMIADTTSKWSLVLQRRNRSREFWEGVRGSENGRLLVPCPQAGSRSLSLVALEVPLSLVAQLHVHNVPLLPSSASGLTLYGSQCADYIWTFGKN